MNRSGAAPCQCHSPGRRVDRVAGPDLEDRAAAGLDPPDALGDVDHLAHGVRVPGVAGARREPDDVHADPRRLLAAGDDVDPRVAGERLRGRLRRSPGFA